ncbi:glycosyltransferase family 2 protein [Peribacillus simplex]|uniref:glycosyltransferase family 2 protein n=1 Tax=Peribacillus simplex TaxID=1478 RepID=UPI002E1FC412|nr:glycosyltransferase family 2 protein [Peribacillus simplex]
MSKVSVIVPVYNAEKYLDKCIKSILNQTFYDIELLLVNDGSKDGSLSICKKYQMKDSRVKIINKENEGSIPTRKAGIEASTSPLITFVDADDWIDKQLVEILYQESTKSHVDITVCNMYKVLGNKNIIKRENNRHYFKEDRLYNTNEIMRDIVPAYLFGHPFPSSLCAKLYKKELFEQSGKYLNRIHFLGDDLFYNMELFLKSKKVKVIDKPLYYYRLGGFTSNYMPYLFEDIVNGYQIQKEVIEEYYIETKNTQYNGISLMLLNTLKTCLYNLFNSQLDRNGIMTSIRSYLENESILEATKNEASKTHFSNDFLNSIQTKDCNYLYRIGEEMYNKRKVKNKLVRIMSLVF